MKRLIFIFAFLVVSAGVLIFLKFIKLNNNFHQFEIQRIAHAGGGVNDETYTNSLEALNLNIKQGFLFFELDFSFTSDNHLVCLHDWKHDFLRSFGFETKNKLTLAEFEKLVRDKCQFQKLTLKTLVEWMKNNPSATIITDVKEDNVKALSILMQKIPDAQNRIIPQIYFPENFEKVKSMGFKKIIWTLYRYKGDNSDVLKRVDKFSQPLQSQCLKKEHKLLYRNFLERKKSSRTFIR